MWCRIVLVILLVIGVAWWLGILDCFFNDLFPKEEYRSLHKDPTSKEMVATDVYSASQKSFEKILPIDNPFLHLEIPSGRKVVFDEIELSCPSGMAAFGQVSSVNYIKIPDDGMKYVENYNHASGEILIPFPVKKILEASTCRFGSSNIMVALRVSGKYHFE
jgi:hypothetical protein